MLQSDQTKAPWRFPQAEVMQEKQFNIKELLQEAIAEVQDISTGWEVGARFKTRLYHLVVV